MKKYFLPPLLALALFISVPTFTATSWAGDQTQSETSSSAKKDDEKVDSVWGAMKFTGRKIESGGKTAGRGIKKGGKAMGRGFKKAGHSIKKFFVGD